MSLWISAILEMWKWRGIWIWNHIQPTPGNRWSKFAEGVQYLKVACSCLPGSGHPLNSALGTENACKRDREEKEFSNIGKKRENKCKELAYRTEKASEQEKTLREDMRVNIMAIFFTMKKWRFNIWLNTLFCQLHNLAHIIICLIWPEIFKLLISKHIWFSQKEYFDSINTWPFSY